MDMRIDETGQDGGAFQVDCLGAWGNFDFVASTNGQDAVAFDEQDGIRDGMREQRML